MIFDAQSLLPFSFYNRETLLVARELLGKILYHKSGEGVTSGRIVETEAYLGSKDEASHAFRGCKGRAEIMYGTPGQAYVYFTYGNHFCFNVVTHDGEAGAALVRALEPLEGIEIMMKRRRVKNTRIHDILELCSGPGKLTQAMDITRQHNGSVLYDPKSKLVILDAPVSSKKQIVSSTRIGIRQATERLYRFTLQGNRFVSKAPSWHKKLP